MSAVTTTLAFFRGALHRLPVEAAAVALLALTTLSAIHADDPSVWHLRLFFTGLFTVPLAFAARQRLSGRVANLIGAGVAVTALGCLCLILPDLRSSNHLAVPWGLGLFGVAAYLAPFVAAAPRFPHFVRRFTEELTTWSLLGGLSLGAILVIGVAIDELFDFATKRLTLDAMVLTAGAMLLLGLERLLPDRTATGKVPEIWRRIVLAVGAPFVAVMLVILVVYELSVLARGELPRNMLSPLIIGAGFTGYFCTLIVSAILAEPTGTGALAPADPHRFLQQRSVWLVRIYPAILLALLPMALVAVVLRIDQYGLTPFRVVRVAALIALAILGAWGTWRLFRRRAPLTWQVPALVAAFALALSAGPWSAAALSLRSQSARLDRLLTAAGVTDRNLAATTDRPERMLEQARWNELVRAVLDLEDLGGAHALAQVLPGATDRCGYWVGAEECLGRLGLSRDGATSTTTRYVEVTFGDATIPAGQARFFGAWGAGYAVDGTALILQEAGERYTADLSAIVAAAQDGIGGSVALPATLFSVRSPEGTPRGHVVLSELQLVLYSNGEHTLSRLSGVWIMPIAP